MTDRDSEYPYNGEKFTTRADSEHLYNGYVLENYCKVTLAGTFAND